MRIIINMEVESPDYEGKAFMREIEKLIKDIDPSGKTYLLNFKMRRKYKGSDDRDFEYERNV